MVSGTKFQFTSPSCAPVKFLNSKYTNLGSNYCSNQEMILSDFFGKSVLDQEQRYQKGHRFIRTYSLVKNHQNCKLPYFIPTNKGNIKNIKIMDRNKLVIDPYEQQSINSPMQRLFPNHLPQGFFLQLPRKYLALSAIGQDTGLDGPCPLL